MCVCACLCFWNGLRSVKSVAHLWWDIATHIYYVANFLISLVLDYIPFVSYLSDCIWGFVIYTVWTAFVLCALSSVIKLYISCLLKCWLVAHWTNMLLVFFVCVSIMTMYLILFLLDLISCYVSVEQFVLHTILTSIYVVFFLHSYTKLLFLFSFDILYFCIMIVYCYALLNHYVKIVWLQISSTLRIRVISVLFCFVILNMLLLWNGLFDRNLCQIDKIKPKKLGEGRKIFSVLNFKMLFSDIRSLIIL